MLAPVTLIALALGVLILTQQGNDETPLIPGTNLLAGKPWDGKGRGPMRQAEAEAFDDYPLLWLGPAFEGFNLQGISHSKYESPGPQPDMDEVVFIYGSCILSGGRESSCAIPLSVSVKPVCYISPEEAGRHAYREPAQTVRGEALALRRSGGPGGMLGPEDAMIWTGGVLLNINSLLPAGAVDRIIHELHGIGAYDIAPGAPLPAPNFQRCGWAS